MHVPSYSRTPSVGQKNPAWPVLWLNIQSVKKIYNIFEHSIEKYEHLQSFVSLKYTYIIIYHSKVKQYDFTFISVVKPSFTKSSYIYLYFQFRTTLLQFGKNL